MGECCSNKKHLIPLALILYCNNRMENSNRALWKLPEMSVETDGANMGSIRARFNMTGSSGSPTTITAHFGCDGSTMSGAEMELVSSGYRTSLVKRRFVAGRSDSHPLIFTPIHEKHEFFYYFFTSIVSPR